MAQKNNYPALPVVDVGLTDQDVYETMKSIPGYLDITPGDFKELYCHAFRHAVERISRSVLGRDLMAKGERAQRALDSFGGQPMKMRLPESCRAKNTSACPPECGRDFRPTEN